LRFIRIKGIIGANITIIAGNNGNIGAIITNSTSINANIHVNISIIGGINVNIGANISIEDANIGLNSANISIIYDNANIGGAINIEDCAIIIAIIGNNSTIHIFDVGISILSLNRQPILAMCIMDSESNINISVEGNDQENYNIKG